MSPRLCKEYKRVIRKRKVNVLFPVTLLLRTARMQTMKFDDIDISILFYLLDNPTQTTSDIAKKIFECKKSDIRKEDSLVRLRLQEMGKIRIVIQMPTSPKTYNVNPECVFSGKGELRIRANGGGIIKVDFDDFLVVTDNKKYMQINRITRNGKNGKTVEIVV